jgi:hypothetical protein
MLIIQRGIGEQTLALAWVLNERDMLSVLMAATGRFTQPRTRSTREGA